MEALQTFKGGQLTLRVFKEHVEVEMPRYYISVPFTAINALQVQKDANAQLTINTGGLEVKFYDGDVKGAYNAILKAINQ